MNESSGAIDVKNNVLYHPAGKVFNFIDSDDSRNTASDYNIVKSGSLVATRNERDTIDFTVWQRGQDNQHSEHDTHSPHVDSIAHFVAQSQRFTNPSVSSLGELVNFSLKQGGAAVDVGVSVPVTKDILQGTRPDTRSRKADIGAFELQ